MDSNGLRHNLTTWNKVYKAIGNDADRLNWSSYYREKLYTTTKDSANVFAYEFVQKWYDDLHSHMTKLAEDANYYKGEAQKISSSTVDKYRDLAKDIRTGVRWLLSGDSRATDKLKEVIRKLDNKEY
jgi:hypothetical protein